MTSFKLVSEKKQFWNNNINNSEDDEDEDEDEDEDATNEKKQVKRVSYKAHYTLV